MKLLNSATAGSALLCALGALAVFLDRWGQRERIQKADAIVVLGAHVREDGTASGALHERTLQAANLFHAGWAPHIITTGAIGTYPPAESQVAKDLAVDSGVPQSAIFTEEASHSTWENAANAAQICRAHGWHRVIVVSEQYHLFRARANFRRHGLQAFVSPAPNHRWPRRLRMTTREAILVLRDWLLRKL